MSNTTATSTHQNEAPPSLLKQPKAVWAVAFASVIAFMGIGLVDPILKPIGEQLDATPSQVSLLFTSYMLVTGVAMLITPVWCPAASAPRKHFLQALPSSSCSLLWQALPAPSARSSDSVRAGDSAMHCSSQRRSRQSSARPAAAWHGRSSCTRPALGIGIAVGPLVGGVLGDISWRAPFFGVAALMAVAFILIVVMLPSAPKPEHHTSIAAPLPGVAAPRATHRCHHRAALQLRILHAARVHAVPPRHGGVPDRIHLLRLGPDAGDLVGFPSPLACNDASAPCR